MYEIKLLTSQGPKTVIYDGSKPLNIFESELTAKYGMFITLSSKLI